MRDIHVEDPESVRPYLNDMSARSVQTTKDKGFRQDWQDAEILELVAERLDQQEHPLFLADPGRGDEVRTAGDELRRIAEQHRMLTIGTKLALVMSEAAEALEDLRDHGIDGVREGESGFAAECADVHIRMFDIEDLCGVDIEEAIVAKQDKNDGRPRMHGRRF